MDTVNVHDVGIDTPTMKVTNRFHWDPHTFKIFIEECMTKLKNGNRQGAYFKQPACQNTCKRLLERTCIDLDRNQMKNKWDIMRKELKYYDHLTRLETGISTNPMRNIISASKEWWDEKIKEDKEYAKFKDKNLDVYQAYYEALFRDTVVVGDKAKVPCEFCNNSTPDDVQFVDITDGRVDTDEVHLFEDVDPVLTYDSSSMKWRGKKLTPMHDNKRKFEGKMKEKVIFIANDCESDNSYDSDENEEIQALLLCGIAVKGLLLTHKNILQVPVFNMLCRDLVARYGLMKSCRVSIEESLSIFLLYLAHGCGNRLVQESFNHSGETIHIIFHKVLDVVVNLSKDIIKPDANYNKTILEHILNNPRYYPLFKDCIGAIDGTHVEASVPQCDQIKYIGRKNCVT
ncbi:unnamed protein product [Lactuca saligna]|uniref:Myb/SANT-like domain-containing protein n=1 Tax=Lactuca saligna TaxID=75948 RepID=A0AA36EH82_LACSI|nr:unnamed protein product [Lactuca saligna]